MSKLYCVMGKSASGKDTLYNMLLKDKELMLKPVVTYTTRPIRSGETDGVTYHYTDAAGLEKLKKDGRVIECRDYDTVHGIWSYFTVDDGQIDGAHLEDQIIIGTLESYMALKTYFGEDMIIPLYIHVDDGERLNRALNRERQQQVPKYAEMCRRFLADEEDFSKAHMAEAKITKIFENTDLNACFRALKDYICECRNL